jgi:hypothetical protein
MRNDSSPPPFAGGRLGWKLVGEYPLRWATRQTGAGPLPNYAKAATGHHQRPDIRVTLGHSPVCARKLSPLFLNRIGGPKLGRPKMPCKPLILCCVSTNTGQSGVENDQPCFCVRRALRFSPWAIHSAETNTPGPREYPPTALWKPLARWRRAAANSRMQARHRNRARGRRRVASAHECRPGR